MVPFCTNAQFLDRYDGRWVAKNILDTGTAPSLAELSNPATTAGGRLEQLLIDASEELMSAAAVGERYSESDIRTYGGNLVLSIVSGLAMGPVLRRRGRAVTNYEQISTAYQEARARLQDLRKGEAIFWQVPDVPQAGTPEVADNTPIIGIDCPSITQQSGRYFGNTGDCNGGGSCGSW